jgi:hypothetical protein
MPNPPGRSFIPAGAPLLFREGDCDVTHSKLPLSFSRPDHAMNRNDIGGLDV